MSQTNRSKEVRTPVIEPPQEVQLGKVKDTIFENKRDPSRTTITIFAETHGDILLDKAGNRIALLRDKVVCLEAEVNKAYMSEWADHESSSVPEPRTVTGEFDGLTTKAQTTTYPFSDGYMVQVTRLLDRLGKDMSAPLVVNDFVITTGWLPPGAAHEVATT